MNKISLILFLLKIIILYVILPQLSCIIKRFYMIQHNIFRNQIAISRYYGGKILGLREENSLISDSFKAKKNQDNKELQK